MLLGALKETLQEAVLTFENINIKSKLENNFVAQIKN